LIQNQIFFTLLIYIITGIIVFIVILLMLATILIKLSFHCSLVVLRSCNFIVSWVTLRRSN
jgi:hypothetical protein